MTRYVIAEVAMYDHLHKLIDIPDVEHVHVTITNGTVTAVPMPTPESCGLDKSDPEDTYLGDGFTTVWIGLKWDIGERVDKSVSLWRKGNYVVTTSMDAALAVIAADQRADDIEVES